MDRYAGKTIRTPEDGYALIESRAGNHPRLGDTAPDFELDLYDGSGRLRLSSFGGDRPTVLIFGSLT